ncbi:MAG: cytochrome c oxidase subunit [Actinomycetota bacterium]
MIKTLRRWYKLAALAPLLFLTACAKDAPQDIFQPEGKYARKIDHLQRPVFYIAGVVFVLVEALVVIAIVKFRQKPDDDEDELPAQMHGNFKLEIGWTIVPALILAVVAAVTMPVIFELTSTPKQALQVNVYGQKYWWGYEYPGQTQYGIEKAGIRTANELHIPAGVTVEMTLRSRDVIHSFWAPKLNGKRDVVPGRTHYWKLEADHPGVYSGQCAEFCGTSHAFMRIKVVAHDQASWQKWVEEMQVPSTKPTSGLAAEGYELFAQKGCKGCHQIDGQYEEVAKDSPAAPNLTKLFTRDCFAGCIYDLDDRNELEAWLRNPQRKAGSLMVIGQLNEDEIDRLYAYLSTLK